MLIYGGSLSRSVVVSGMGSKSVIAILRVGLSSCNGSVSGSTINRWNKRLQR